MNEIAQRLARRLFDQKLIGNEYRSAFIKAMIEPHLVPFGWRHVGDEWNGWDFQRGEDTRLEVKQSAAWQTWSKRTGKASPGTFDIAPRTGYWDSDGTTWIAAPGRHAQTYVLAWNGETGAAADHRDPAQWDFFVVAALRFGETQKTIALSRVRTLANPMPLSALAAAVEAVAKPVT